MVAKCSYLIFSHMNQITKDCKRTGKVRMVYLINGHTIDRFLCLKHFFDLRKLLGRYKDKNIRTIILNIKVGNY